MKNLIFRDTKFPEFMGYSADFKADMKYIPTIDNIPITYNGRIKVLINTEECINIELPDSLKQISGSDFHAVYEGETIITPEQPLRINIHVKERRLEKKPVYKPITDEIHEANKILEDIGVEEFNYDNMIEILDWMRVNLHYKKEIYISKIDQALKTRKGICRNFSEILDYFVRKTGGISNTRNGYMVKQPHKEKLIAHYWNEIYFNDLWNVVDPTIYMRSKENKEKAINGTKTMYYFMTPTVTIISTIKNINMDLTECSIKH